MATSGEPKPDSPLFQIEFPKLPYKRDAAVEAKVGQVVSGIQAKNIQPNPFVVQYFEDPNLFKSLPPELREDDQALEDLIVHCGKFNQIIYKERDKRYAGDLTGLFGEKVDIPETLHQGGQTRRAESDYKINVEYLKSLRIDPKKVLFFRRTQPSPAAPKPEYYWTSDFSEVLKGLTVEIRGDSRKNSIILIASLDAINKNGGLIQDINDDSGLAVRQIGTGPFDQSEAIASFQAGLPS